MVGIFPLLADQAERLVDEPLAAQQLSGPRCFPRPALERFLCQGDLRPWRQRYRLPSGTLSAGADIRSR